MKAIDALEYNREAEYRKARVAHFISLYAPKDGYEAENFHRVLGGGR